jgi:hypothetical protein
MASQLLGLRLGIAPEQGHPMWYLNMRWKRLTQQQKPTLKIISTKTNQNKPDLDSMERSMPLRSNEMTLLAKKIDPKENESTLCQTLKEASDVPF